MTYSRPMLLAPLSVLFVTLMLVKPVVNQLPDASDAKVTYLNGTGGVVCGKTVCLSDLDMEVSCQRDKCICGESGDKGDGIIVCAERNEHICYMINDPRIKPFSGPGVNVPVSCKFLVTALETTNVIVGGGYVKCVIEATSWGVKGRGAGRTGKHFSGGMELSVTVSYGGKLYYHSVRISGEGENGIYKFTEQVTKTEDGEYGMAEDTIIDGVGTISTFYDEVNNIAEVRADMCGVRMGFRPAEFEADKSDDELAPGVYIKVNKWNFPQFMAGLCLAPKFGVDDLVEQFEEKTGKEVSKEVAMMAVVLQNPVNQNFPDAPGILQALAKTAQECDTKSLICAIENCMFITQTPKFLRCYGRNSKDHDLDGVIDEDNKGDQTGKERENKRMSNSLHLMHRCFQGFCVHSSDFCKLVKNAIRETPCEKHIPVTQKGIMAFNCSLLDMKPLTNEQFAP